MLKFLFIFSILLSFAYSNLFIITDKKGKIVHSKALKQTNNASITQKATEYSFQAIYDELHKAENLAHMAAAARKRAERIAKAQQAAKKAGKTYHISESDRKKLLEDAKYFKGGKYVWGGTTPQGFDCSGYVQYLYKKHNINLKIDKDHGASDGRFFSAKNIPVVMFKPICSQPHIDNEWIELKSLEKFYQILKGFLIDKN